MMQDDKLLIPKLGVGQPRAVRSCNCGLKIMGWEDHLMRWEEVSRGKSNGGLGIRKLKECNQVLLGKWLWQFAVERHSL